MGFDIGRDRVDADRNGAQIPHEMDGVTWPEQDEPSEYL